MSSKLVALIIGAGPNVGLSVAKALAAQNYKVAVGSRNPKGQDTDFYQFAVDVTQPDSVKAAFANVTKALGPPNVVVFNAATFAPPNETDPLSLPFDDFKQVSVVGDSLYVAAQEALASFRTPGHKDSPKTFIVTGNVLPFIPGSPPIGRLGLGLQKRTEAYLIEIFHNAYVKEDIRFHYALLVSPEGFFPPFDKAAPENFWISGPAHGSAYWNLISAKAPEQWDYRFTFDGKKYEKK